MLVRKPFHLGRDGDRPLGYCCFEAILGILRIFIFTHTARRLDLGLSAQVFRHLMQLPWLILRLVGWEAAQCGSWKISVGFSQAPLGCDPR